MPEHTRKLAAIVFTDIVGFTEIMGSDEKAAMALLEKQRRLLRPIIENFEGEWLKEIGDGLLFSFPSAVKAVTCALEIQRILEHDPKLTIRIGIHIGDIIKKDGDVFGDGVNIASRLEPLAEPGGICVSERVYDDIRNKPEINAKFQDEQMLKGVEHPIKVYSIFTKIGAIPEETLKEKPQKTNHLNLPLISILVLGLIGLIFYFFNSQTATEPYTASAGQNSVAIMYFQNLTGQAEMDWVEQGVVEMLTTNLGRIAEVNTISSQRLFDIMNQIGAVDTEKINKRLATEIAQKAGVRTMVMGSVLGTESELRINAQLVDVESGILMGTEILEAGIKGSLFSMVDELTERITEKVAGKTELTVDVSYSLTHSMEAMSTYVRGTKLLNEFKLSESIEMFERAISIDSTFAMAHYNLGIAEYWGVNSPDRAFKIALQYEDKMTNREAMLIKAELSPTIQEKLDAYERLLEIYPSEKFAWYFYGEVLAHAYWPRRSLDAFKKAVELDPSFALAYFHLCDINYFLENFSEAEKYTDIGLAIAEGNYFFYTVKASIYLNNNNLSLAEFHVNQMVSFNEFDSTSREGIDPYIYQAKINNDYARMEFLLNKINEISRSEFYKKSSLYLLAGFMAEQGKLKKAGKYLELAFEIKPDSPFQFYEMGNFAVYNNDIENAQNYAEKIINMVEDGTVPFEEVKLLSYHIEVMVNLKQENLENARKAANKMVPYLSINDNELSFLYKDSQSRITAAEGNFTQALEHADTAIQNATLFYWDAINVPHNKIRAGLISSLLKAKRYTDVIKIGQDLYNYLFSNSTTTTLSFTESKFRLGVAYQETGQIEKAIKIYNELAEIWKDADEDYALANELKHRLESLKE